MKTEPIEQRAGPIKFGQLDAFTRAYIECALWSSQDYSDGISGGDALDVNYSGDDLTQDALRAIAADCEAFQRDNAEMLARAGTDERNGHDFWLTRNGHGAGFWDRDYLSDVSTPLTYVAHSYGECNLYVTDDGEVSL